MRTFFPVEELARDERFNTDHEQRADGRPAHRRRPHRRRCRRKPKRNNNRLTPSRRDASDAARGLMHGIFVGEIQALEGAGRTCHDFGARPRHRHRRQHPDHRQHGAVRAQAGHGPPGVGRGPPRRDQREAQRLDGHRDRPVRREHGAVRGRVQHRPGAAPRRRQPRPRGSGDRRLHHDEGVRRSGRRPVPRVLRGLDARRRGDPREDGQRLAAQGHRERSRAAQEGARVPERRRQVVQLRRHAQRQRGVADRPGPPLPRARRVHRRPRSTTSPTSAWRRSTSARPSVCAKAPRTGRRLQADADAAP